MRDNSRLAMFVSREDCFSAEFYRSRGCSFARERMSFLVLNRESQRPKCSPFSSSSSSSPSIKQAIQDLENTNQELKADLENLFICGASEVAIANRTAVVIHVPYRYLKSFHKIQQRLVRELEKKFSNKDVVFVGNRRIRPVPRANFARARPRSRTLTAVHASLLEDLVYPTEIVGKRQRYRLDGSKLLKVYLDPSKKTETEYKLETFAGVYKKLTGKDVSFEFTAQQA